MDGNQISSRLLRELEHHKLVNIQAQAKWLCLAILLIAHIPRHPYGAQVEEVILLAATTIVEVKQAMQITEHPVKMNRPLLDRSVSRTPRSREQAESHRLGGSSSHFSRNFRTMVKQQVKTFWGIRN